MSAPIMHTPTPWNWAEDFDASEPPVSMGIDIWAKDPMASKHGRLRVAQIEGCGTEDHANAARIVACVNEMDGLDPRYARWAAQHHENVLQDSENLIEENIRLRSERDELLATLKGVVAVADRDTDVFAAARAAIAKVQP